MIHELHDIHAYVNSNKGGYGWQHWAVWANPYMQKNPWEIKMNYLILNTTTDPLQDTIQLPPSVQPSPQPLEVPPPLQSDIFTEDSLHCYFVTWPSSIKVCGPVNGDKQSVKHRDVEQFAWSALCLLKTGYMCIHWFHYKMLWTHRIWQYTCHIAW